MSTRGRQAEQRAAVFQQRQGLTLVARNYHCRYGEIDLIARDGPRWYSSKYCRAAALL